MTRIGLWTGVAALAMIGMTARADEPAAPKQEAWDAVYIAGSKVGYMWTRVVPVQDRGQSYNNVLVDFHLTLRRGKDTSVTEVQYGTIETPEGQVLRLDTRTYASAQLLRVHGDVVGGKMTLKIENGNQRQEKVIPWGPDVLGPYGPELSFSRTPMKPGDSRTIKTFVPDLNLVAVATLAAKGVEPVALGGNTTRELLRVEQEVATEEGKRMPEMAQTFWVDASGQVLKTHSDNFGGMETYRTTKEAATRRLPSGGLVDLIDTSIVRLSRQIPNPENTRDIVYKATLTDADPAQVFPADARQAVTAGREPKTGQIEVKTTGPDTGPAGPESVGEEFLRPNALITCRDFTVVAHARQAVGNATDPWAKAQAITHWVAKKILDKNFETGFAPADEVARTLSGDCTEHAVLTAAMCRSEGIPARVVVGLVYASHLKGFGFHMWDEVYVNRRWVAVDSAFDQTQVDAVHIKLSDTSLDGVAPFETFLSVVRVANKLKLEAVEIR